MRRALRLICLMGLTAAMSFAQQVGTINVTKDGSPGAGIDIFVFVNQGKQPAGKTSTQGRLPFDPALLVGKIQGEAIERRCETRTEIILVVDGEDYRCDEDDADREDCECEPAGAWLFSNGQISVRLQPPAATPLTRNPLFYGGLGAGVATAIVVGSGDDGDSSSTLMTTSGSGGTTPSNSTGSGGTDSTPSATSFNGSYPGNFVRRRDECNFFVANFNGSAVIEADPSGSMTARVVESITRTYLGTIQLTSEGNGSGVATGTGSIGNIPINCEARLTFVNGRLTIEETIRMPENGNCAATFRAESLSRQ